MFLLFVRHRIPQPPSSQLLEHLLLLLTWYSRPCFSLQYSFKKKTKFHPVTADWVAFCYKLKISNKQDRSVSIRHNWFSYIAFYFPNQIFYTTSYFSHQEVSSTFIPNSSWIFFFLRQNLVNFSKIVTVLRLFYGMSYSGYLRIEPAIFCPLILG